jgi:hypothetical protein
LNAAIAISVALLIPGNVLGKVDVGSEPSSPSVHIEVKRYKPGDSIRSKRSDGRRSSGQVGGQSPCTYAGFYVTCNEPNPAQPASGVVFTPAVAEQAVAEIPLPKLRLQVQPAGPTLVNVDTIFWCEPRSFSTSIELLGHTIDVEAEPVRFTWVHGDGTQRTTRKPGSPYPSKDVTHRYMRPAKQFAAHVDTTYAVRYAIDGDGWTDLGDTLTATGPSTPIEVREALPVLVH